jgi:hemerythrin-like domain-containing protein
MKATDLLRDDHRLIERTLAALAMATVQLEQSAPVRPGFFLGVVEFFEGFVHGVHYRREEGVFFPAMERAGAPRTAGPLAVAIREHEESRGIARAMRSAAERWGAGDESARQQLAEDARRYVSLLKQHIAREDQLLFPMAEDMIPGEDHFQLVDDLTQPATDSGGGQDFFVALVAALEKEVGH